MNAVTAIFFGIIGAGLIMTSVSLLAIGLIGLTATRIKREHIEMFI